MSDEIVPFQLRIDEAQIVRKPFIGDELGDKVQIALANSVGNSSNKIVRLRR